MAADSAYTNKKKKKRSYIKDGHDFSDEKVSGQLTLQKFPVAAELEFFSLSLSFPRVHIVAAAKRCLAFARRFILLKAKRERPRELFNSVRAHDTCPRHYLGFL